MNNEKILNPDFLEAKREEMQKDWIKKAFYGFITGIFRQKTTFERYGLLMLVLQLVTLFCSYISYVTGHAFIEQYIGAWVKNPASVFWASVACIVLLEAVKMLSAMPLFIGLVRLQGFRWGSFALVGLTFAFSMYISYEGAEDKVLATAAPTLVNTAEIASYYDNQIKDLKTEKDKYLNGAEYRTKAGQIYHKVLDKHINPLSAEIARITALRDTKINNAESKNATIEAKHDKYTTADARTMAFIALGADGVKLIISLLTAWFFVASAKDYEIINDDSGAEGDKFGKSEFGLLESMPPTEAAPKNHNTPKEQPQPTPTAKQIGFEINSPKDSIKCFDNSKDSKPAFVVQGLNKGAPMTKSEMKKQRSKYKSRVKAIEAGSRKHGKKATALNNIQKLEIALQKFN